MNYYYDLTLCFKEKKIYKFYEWELDDNLWEIKKIPLYRIDTKTLINLYKYNGKIESSFLKKIKNRTIYKKDGKIKTILYAVIFTDAKFSIALLLDAEGYILKRSYLMLEDDLNTCEIAHSLKKEKLIFNKCNKTIVFNGLRQEELMKNKIKNAIDKLYKNKNFSKLIYYYLEWFKQYNNNIDIIYSKMIQELEKNIINLDEIYNLVLQLTK